MKFNQITGDVNSPARVPDLILTSGHYLCKVSHVVLVGFITSSTNTLLTGFVHGCELVCGCVCMVTCGWLMSHPECVPACPQSISTIGSRFIRTLDKEASKDEWILCFSSIRIKLSLVCQKDSLRRKRGFVKDADSKKETNMIQL